MSIASHTHSFSYFKSSLLTILKRVTETLMTDAVLHIDFFWYGHVKQAAFTLIELCVLGHLSTR